LLARLVRKLALEQKHQSQVAEQLSGDFRFAGQRFVAVGPCVAPASDLGRAVVSVQVVVHSVSVGDQVPVVAAQELSTAAVL
jgi:hypothetical protein